MIGRSPLIILADIPARERPAVKSALLRLQRPIYAEAHSGLREDPDLQPFILHSGDRFFSVPRVRESFDSVIRIGGIPTVRLWRDLEDKLAKWPVYSIHHLPWSGLAREKASAVDYATGLTALAELDVSAMNWAAAKDVSDTDARCAEKLARLFQKYPEAEPSLVARLSRELPPGARVFVGNSLPIREWDLAADYGRAFTVASNRGLNGIDGLVSTFLGWSQPGVDNVLLLGDLSALYDLAGLWPLAQGMVKNRCRIVVINNGGGRIFQRMFKNPAFENSHEIRFAAWARMFGLPYFEFSGGEWPAEATSVVEVRPDPSQTEKFHDEYEAIFQSE